jgi:hypothetical protein
MIELQGWEPLGPRAVGSEQLLQRQQLAVRAKLFHDYMWPAERCSDFHLLRVVKIALPDGSCSRSARSSRPK